MTIGPDHRVGAMSIARIGEIEASFPAATLIPGWTAEAANLGQTPDEAASGQLGLSVHSWLVRSGNRVILVDAGVGNGKTRRQALFNGLSTPFLTRLAEAGVAPIDVTDILLTHLHTDHVGWLTTLRDGRWIPTFSNARTLMPKAGWDWFVTGEGRTQPNRDMVLDSVLPVVEAGQVAFVPPEGGEALAGFRYHPTPGHSLDHMSIILESAGERAIFAGDVLHHPVQVARPELNSMFCADPAQARRSRLWALGTAAQDGLTWFSSHCPAPSVGVIRASTEGYRWEGI